VIEEDTAMAKKRTKAKPTFPPFKKPKYVELNDDEIIGVQFSWNQTCIVVKAHLRDYWKNPPHMTEGGD